MVKLAYFKTGVSAIMSGKYRLACLTKNKTNPAYVGAQVGAARLASELGCELLSWAPDIPDNIEEQIRHVHEAIAKKVDAILISPVHTSEIDEALKKAQDAGIVLVFFVTSTDGITPDAFMTSDNYALGLDIAEYLINDIERKGNIVVLEGLPQSPTSPPRTEAFLKAASSHSEINVIATAIGNYQRAEGKEEMAKILAEYPNIDGVISANDIMALGAIEAMEEAGRSIKIVGMNAMPEAIKAILSGKLLATVSYDALSLVGLAVQAAIKILNGEKVPLVVSLSADIIDADNCEVWDKPYEARPLPEWDSVIASLPG